MAAMIQRFGARVARPVGSRGMATEKQLRTRISSVGNIKKITSAMKMVAAAKLRGAQNALDVARVFAVPTAGVWNPPAAEDTDETKLTYVAMTSDRGLCGGVNSQISRHVRDQLLGSTLPKENIGLITVGDKGKQALERVFGKHFKTTISEHASQRPTFATASAVAQELMSNDHDRAVICYNQFVNMLRFESEELHIAGIHKMDETAQELEPYELEGESELLANFYEYNMASQIFLFMREGEASEHSSRMNAMGNSSKNAGEMLESLTLLYNRTRQARITTELIEIISGAVALEDDG